MGFENQTVNRGRAEKSRLRKEAVKVNIDKLLKNPKIKKIFSRLGLKISSKDDVMKVLNYFARNPAALSAITGVFGESINEALQGGGKYKSINLPKVGDKIKFKSDPSRVFTLKQVTVGNPEVKDDKNDPSGTVYIFVHAEAGGNRKERFTKETWWNALKKRWITLESINEGHTISFSKEEMAQLHKDGQIEKDGHKYIYDESVFAVNGLFGETVNEVGELISKSKVKLLKVNAKFLADDLMDMYKELGRKHADISPALIIQHLDYLKDKVKMMRKNVGLRESVNEGQRAFLAYRTMKEGIEDTIKGIRILRGHIDNAPYNKKFSLMTSELYKFQIDMEKKLHKFIPQISKLSKDKTLESVNEARMADTVAKALIKMGKVKKGMKEEDKIGAIYQYLQKHTNLSKTNITYYMNEPDFLSDTLSMISYFLKESVNEAEKEKSKKDKEEMERKAKEQAKKDMEDEFDFDLDESVNEDIGIDTYLGGIVKAMRNAGLKPKTAKQMKSGFSVSKNKIGFFIDVEQRGFDKIEKYTLQIEVDKKGDLWYLSGNRPLHMGPWANTNRVTRMFRMLNKIRGFGQTKFGKI